MNHNKEEKGFALITIIMVSNFGVTTGSENIELTANCQEALLGGDMLSMREIIVPIRNICTSDPVNIEKLS